MTAVVIEGVKRWDPLGTYAQRDVLQEQLEKVKKNTQHEHGDKYGKHWDKQHAEMKSFQTPAVLPSSTKTDDSPIRITVPIWLRKGHQRMYTEFDPEWKEFVKLQNDKKRLDQIKRQVGEAVVHQIGDNGKNKFELALIKFNGRVGIALEVVPQVFTPPIYEVPCFLISPSSLSFGWRPLTAQAGARMERVFRPVVLFDASTAALGTFFSITYAVTKAKIMDKLGWSKVGNAKSTIVLPQIPPESPDQVNASSATNTQSAKPIFPRFPSLENGDAMRKMHSDVVGSMPYSVAIQHATYAFNHVRNARQKLAVSTNVKGVCQVRGHITFFGDRGKFNLEVIAYYLPTDNVFLGAISVKSGWVVQDYRAWEKLKENERKQREQKRIQSKTPNAPTGSTPTKPTSTPSPDDNNDEDDKNNG